MGKSFFMLVKKTVTSIILSQLLPADSKTDFTFAKTAWHSASMSYDFIFPFLLNLRPGIELSFGLLGPMPERNKRFPTLLACGYAPSGVDAFSVLMILLIYFATKARRACGQRQNMTHSRAILLRLPESQYPTRLSASHRILHRH